MIFHLVILYYIYHTNSIFYILDLEKNEIPEYISKISFENIFLRKNKNKKFENVYHIFQKLIFEIYPGISFFSKSEWRSPKMRYGIHLVILYYIYHTNSIFYILDLEKNEIPENISKSKI